MSYPGHLHQRSTCAAGKLWTGKGPWPAWHGFEFQHCSKRRRISCRQVFVACWSSPVTYREFCQSCYDTYLGNENFLLIDTLPGYQLSPVTSLVQHCDKESVMTTNHFARSMKMVPSSIIITAIFYSAHKSCSAVEWVWCFFRGQPFGDPAIFPNNFLGQAWQKDRKSFLR